MGRVSTSGRLVAVLLAAAVSLTLAVTAAADDQKIRLSPVGQAAARAAVLRRTDLGRGSGWTGGAKKPALSSTPTCPNFRPKQSDLVLIGAAKTVWKDTGLEFDSDAKVLKSPAMVRLDWQRTVLAPQVLPCLRMMIARQVGSSSRLVSFGRTDFPELGTYSRAYRALVDVTTAGTTVRVMADIVAVGRGSTEITLVTSAPLAAASSVVPAEIRLVRLLLARVRP
jgi:hypothetical protein